MARVHSEPTVAYEAEPGRLLVPMNINPSLDQVASVVGVLRYGNERLEDPEF